MIIWWLFLGVAAVALGSLLFMAVIQLATALDIWRSRRRAELEPSRFEPITVLKPIKGVDAALEANLLAFAAQDYPCYQLVVGIEDPQDPAIFVVRRFQQQHPELDMRIVVGGARLGMNPKVANLSHMSRHARHDLWLISDADVLPDRGYLKRMVKELEGKGVGLVHNLLVGQGERALGAVFESIHMNTFVAAAVWGADRSHHSCVIGKSMFFHRRLLEELGGWQVVENVLAEDYVLGRLVQDRGLKVRLCKVPLAVRNPARTLGEFVNRHLRWAQMRRRVSLFAYLCEPISNPTGWISLLLLLWVTMPLPLTASFAQATCVVLGTLGLKCLSDDLVARSMGSRSVGWRWHWVLLKDLLIFGLWFVGLFKRTVNWRGNVMLIGPGSQLYEISEEALAARGA